MEHRWNRRHPVCLDALVLHRESGLRPAKVVNISLEGVFIELEHPVLPSRALVELSFALAVAGKETIQHMHAFVVHHNRGGYGLMFKDFRRSAFLGLVATLSAA